MLKKIELWIGGICLRIVFKLCKRHWSTKTLMAFAEFIATLQEDADALSGQR